MPFAQSHRARLRSGLDKRFAFRHVCTFMQASQSPGSAYSQRRVQRVSRNAGYTYDDTQGAAFLGSVNILILPVAVL